MRYSTWKQSICDNKNWVFTISPSNNRHASRQLQLRMRCILELLAEITRCSDLLPPDDETKWHKAQSAADQREHAARPRNSQGADHAVNSQGDDGSRNTPTRSQRGQRRRSINAVGIGGVVDHSHEDALIPKTIGNHRQQRHDPVDRQPRRPPEPEQGNDKHRAAGTRKWQAQILGVLVRVSPDETLGVDVVEVPDDVGDQRAPEHHDKGDPGLAGRETVDSMKDIWEYLQQHVEYGIDECHINTR